MVQKPNSSTNLTRLSASAIGPGRCSSQERLIACRLLAEARAHPPQCGGRAGGGRTKVRGFSLFVSIGLLFGATSTLAAAQPASQVAHARLLELAQQDDTS